MQGWHPENPLAPHVQRLAAGYHNLHVGACCQDVCDRRCCLNYLLIIVQEQEQLFATQELGQRLCGWAAARIGETKHLDDGGSHHFRLDDGCKRHEESSILKM